jgi:tetratricopeptide (TPR) repeat protein
VTTSSLEALQVYVLARQALGSNRAAESVSLYKRAISLDPNFAMAYLGLGVNYFNLDETSQATANVQKAYELRERVSQREKLGIEMLYDAVVTRNFEAARKSGVLTTQIYPREWAAFTNLGAIYGYLGDYDNGLASSQKAAQIAPGVLQNYTNLIIAYTHSGRLQEAESAALDARSHKLDSPFVNACLYQVDFLKHDSAAMEREAAQVVGKPGFEDLIYYYESDVAAYGGQFVKARELTRHAADSALRAGQKETAAEYEAESAVREGLVDNLVLAKRQAQDAQALSNGRDVTAISALALAMAGDSTDSNRMAEDLGKLFPEETPMVYNLLPTIRAATALRNGDAQKALATLTTSAPYELGQTTQQTTFVLYPVYLRGEAYLAAKQGAAAATEFQKILDHPGLVQNEPIGALAHLQIGRAYAMSGDTARAKTAYQNFLSLWKDADPDILIVKQAKSEYAKLQ